MIDPTDFYRSAVVSMLNVLGDRLAEPCGGQHCEGCEFEASEATRLGLEALGYETWQEFHDAEVLPK